MAYKKIPTTGLGIEVEKFDPTLQGKYLARYRKSDKRKNGVATQDGWLIWPVVNKKRHHEFFADKAHNQSPAESLLAAITRRDQVLAERDQNPAPFGTNIFANNISGRNGVSFAKERYKTTAKGTRTVHQSACWCATWTDKSGEKPQSICKKFSIKLHGYVPAFQMAVLARWEWENEQLVARGKKPNATYGVTRVPWMDEIEKPANRQIINNLLNN